MRFSILMPTHDRADVVGFAIRSVLAQTERDFEVLVVGDGCTDGTAAVVASFGDPRIRWFDFPKGPGFGYANRNAALREAQGEFIAYAAHDDLLLPDHLARLAARLESAPADWAYSRPLWVAPQGFIYPASIDFSLPSHLAYFLNVTNVIPASCVMHRRRLFETCGYWPEDVPAAGDWHLWRRMIRSGAAYAYEPVPTTVHFKAAWKLPERWAPRSLAFAATLPEFDGWPASLAAAPGPLSLQAMLWSAIAAEDQGWVASMRESLVRALDQIAWKAGAELAERHVRVLLKAARFAHRAGETLDALSMSEEALSLAPGDINASFQSGNYLLALGRRAEALQLMEAAVAAEPRSAQLRLMLSRALEDNGNMQEALKEIERAADLAPNDPQVQKRLSVLRQKLSA